MYTDTFDPEEPRTHRDEVNRYIGIGVQRAALWFLWVYIMGGDVTNALLSMLDKSIFIATASVALLLWMLIPYVRAVEHNTAQFKSEWLQT